jgi:hypothetical protein
MSLVAFQLFLSFIYEWFTVYRRSFLEFAVSALRLKAHTLTYLEFYFWRLFYNITSGHLILQDGITNELC